MSAKLNYENKQKLHEKIFKGAEVLYENVSSTLGPRGRNVILQEKGKRPIITKDGVTVAKFVSLEEPFENLGCQIIKQASEKTVADAGDGTTTAVVLAYSMLKYARKRLSSGLSPIELKRGMDKAAKELIDNLREDAQPISSMEDITNIAVISSNGDEVIGRLISSAIEMAGKDGAIQINESGGLETSLDIIEGFQFDSGYVASAFLTDERRGVASHADPLILVTDYKVETIENMLPVLETVARDGRPLVIVSDAMEGQALAALIMNTVRGSMKIVAVKAPRYGQERRQILKDLATTVGATFVSRESGMPLKDVKLEHLGTCKSIEVSKNDTIIIGGKGNEEEIDKRIDSLQVELRQTENINECQRIQERITRLASGIAVINLGASTEIEMIEKRHRVEDALEAVRSAQEEGIVVGGGVALIRASSSIEPSCENEEQEAGYRVVLEAIKEPVRQMARNAGLSPDLSLSIIENETGSRGLNYVTNEALDMLEEGIVDPAKVTICALRNAVSVAGTLITANYAIVEK
jgi:chaperonin GroEL